MEIAGRDFASGDRIAIAAASPTLAALDPIVEAAQVDATAR